MPRIFETVHLVTICSPWMLCEQLQAISCNLFKSIEFETPTLLSFEFPKVEIHCSSLPPQQRQPPPSLNKWWPPSLNEWPVSSLSQWTAGILPLSCWHSPSLDEQPCPPSLNKWPHLPSLDKWLASSLSQWTAGFLPPSMNSCPSTFDNSPILPLADGLPCLNEQLPPSFDEWPPPSLDKWSLPSLPQWTVSSLNRCSAPLHQVGWLWVKLLSSSGKTWFGNPSQFPADFQKMGNFGKLWK